MEADQQDLPHQLLPLPVLSGLLLNVPGKHLLQEEQEENQDHGAGGQQQQQVWLCKIQRISYTVNHMQCNAILQSVPQ